MFICLINSLQAQEFGIKAGASMNKITNLIEDGSSQSSGYSQESKNEFLVGFSVGGTFEYKFNDNFGAVTGLTFRQAGTKFHQNASSSYTDFDGSYKMEVTSNLKLKTTYLEIPIFLKAGFYIGETKIYGLFGGYASLGLTASYRSEFEYTETDGAGNTYTETNSDSDDLDFSFDDSKDLAAMNYGIIPGIGMEYKNFQLEATYNLGLNNVLNQSNQSNRSQSINLTVGYKFGKN